MGVQEHSPGDGDVGDGGDGGDVGDVGDDVGGEAAAHSGAEGDGATKDDDGAPDLGESVISLHEISEGESPVSHPTRLDPRGRKAEPTPISLMEAASRATQGAGAVEIEGEEGEVEELYAPL